MPTWYTNLPSIIDPVAFTIGIFEVRWYAIMYMLAFLIVYLLVQYRLYRGEGKWSLEVVDGVFLWSFIGAVIGAKVGYILFYDLASFLQSPLSAISPLSSDGSWQGISGLSFHGGIFGALLFGYFFTRRKKLSFLALADFIVPAVGAGYVFGRMGNFLNGELFGRVTTSAWGMIVDGVLRIPSQFIEAFLEGLLPFMFLWFLRNKQLRPGTLLLGYIALYSVGRFIAEFFRQPDAHIGFVWNWMSMGQVLSGVFLIIAIGAFSLYFLPKRDDVV